LRGGTHLRAGERRFVSALGGVAFDLVAPGLGCTQMAGPPCDLDGDGFNDLFLGFGTSVEVLEFYLVLGRAQPLDVVTVGKDFRRGDANADGQTNIADAIFVLSYLFGAGKVPTCMDAADANDDETINVADAVRLLAFLFGGAADLPVPLGTCGGDPLGRNGALGCESFEPCARTEG
jgi:hypothetical protein